MFHDPMELRYLGEEKMRSLHEEARVARLLRVARASTARHAWIERTALRVVAAMGRWLVAVGRWLETEAARRFCGHRSPGARG